MVTAEIQIYTIIFITSFCFVIGFTYKENERIAFLFKFNFLLGITFLIYLIVVSMFQ